MIDLVHHEARYIAHLNRQMMKLLEAELAPLELGPGRYLELQGQPAEHPVLQDRRRQRAALAISRLEQNGYVRRRADPNDRRSMRVYLTAKGRRLQPQLEAAAKHCIDNMTRELDGHERVELRRLLEKMASPLIRANQSE